MEREVFSFQEGWYFALNASKIVQKMPAARRD
jgi:hypothetical protein